VFVRRQLKVAALRHSFHAEDRGVRAVGFLGRPLPRDLEEDPRDLEQGRLGKHGVDRFGSKLVATLG